MTRIETQHRPRQVDAVGRAGVLGRWRCNLAAPIGGRAQRGVALDLLRALHPTGAGSEPGYNPGAVCIVTSGGLYVHDGNSTSSSPAR